MSVKAEEEEDSGLYYSDEDDDLGAFSDAEIGCEDGGRTTLWRSQTATKKKAACCTVYGCQEGAWRSVRSQQTGTRQRALRPDLTWSVRQTKLQFHAEDKQVKCWRAQGCNFHTNFIFSLVPLLSPLYPPTIVKNVDLKSLMWSLVWSQSPAPLHVHLSLSKASTVGSFEDNGLNCSGWTLILVSPWCFPSVAPPLMCRVRLQRLLERGGQTSYPADGSPEEWEVVHPEGGFPQDVPQRDPVPGEHQQDLQRGRVKQLLCQFPDLGLSWTDRFFWAHLWLWNDLPGHRSADLCYWLPGQIMSTTCSECSRVHMLSSTASADDACISHLTLTSLLKTHLCVISSAVSGFWQDDYTEAVSRLHLTVTRAYKVNTNINFEVFIHKVDGLSDDHKIQKQRDIHKRANDDLTDASLQFINLRSGSPHPHISHRVRAPSKKAEMSSDRVYSFYLTSIYDHSIFEAFSKVVQKLIPQLPTLENLLNIFISVSFSDVKNVTFPSAGLKLRISQSRKGVPPKRQKTKLLYWPLDRLNPVLIALSVGFDYFGGAISWYFRQFAVDFCGPPWALLFRH